MRGTSKIIRGLLLGMGLALAGVQGAQAEIKVGVSDWPGWVAWYVAQEKGFFKKHGADVQLVWFPNYTDSIQALSSGRLDANSQALSDSLAPFAKNLPLKVVLVNDNSAGNDAILARPAIKSIKDLKGKAVALEQYTLSHFLLLQALAKNGMNASDVRIVNMGAGDAAAAFMAGRVDAAAVWNPWVNRIQSSGKGHAIFTSRDIPGLIPDLLVAQQKSIAAHRQDYVGMIRAWFDAVQFIQTQPQAAAKIMAPKVKLPPEEYVKFLSGTRFFDAKLNQQALSPGNTPISLYYSGPVISRFLISQKLLQKVPDMKVHIDTSLYNAAVAK